jgi:hypothetical protein
MKKKLKYIEDDKMKGHIKVQKHEEGERSTKYFLGLERN